jgi:hypothetical protein
MEKVTIHMSLLDAPMGVVSDAIKQGGLRLPGTDTVAFVSIMV